MPRNFRRSFRHSHATSAVPLSRHGMPYPPQLPSGPRVAYSNSYQNELATFLSSRSDTINEHLREQIVARPTPPRRQGVYWLLTIPAHAYVPYLPPAISYIRGQLERGHETGYEHWQLLVVFRNKQSLQGVQHFFGSVGHYELSRSNAATDYVWKEDTRIAGTQFELGSQPFRRNDQAHWDDIREQALSGNYQSIPSQVFICHYRNLTQISLDNLRPFPVHRRVRVYWGRTGSGKSHTAWEEATYDAYPKDPCTKFWYGYNRQENVIIDEFRGQIGISHLLRWTDHYPCLVENKGGGCTLVARNIWITSNLHPREWYPELDTETINALLRRLEITEF